MYSAKKQSINNLKIILSLAFIADVLYVNFQNDFFLKTIPAFLILISVLILIKSFFSFLKKKNRIHPFFKFILTLLLIWCLVIIFRSFSFNFSELIVLFTNIKVGGIVWLTPFFIIFAINKNIWINFFPFLLKLMIFGCCLFVLELAFGFNLRSLSLLSISIFFLISFSLHSKKAKIISIFSFLLFNMQSILISEHRSYIFITLLTILFSLSVNLKFRSKYIFSIIISLFLYITIYPQVRALTENNRNLTLDTRSFLIEELFDDMSTDELLIGRGALGKYFSTYFYKLNRLNAENIDNYDRSVNEIGYLNMILKGGYVLLLLKLMILIPASYLGIFKSKNDICKMSGYYILLYLILSTLIFPTEYKIEFFLLWFAVGTAISPYIRKLNNYNIKTIKIG